MFFAVAFLLGLGALLLVPVGFARRQESLTGERQRLLEPASSVANALPVAFALQATSARALLAVDAAEHEPFVRAYERARAEEERALSRLRPHEAQLSPAVQEALEELRRSSANWHVLAEALVRGGLREEHYVSELNAQERRLRELFDATERLGSVLHEQRRDLSTRQVALHHAQGVTTTVLAFLSLLLWGIAVGLQRRAGRVAKEMEARRESDRIAKERADVLAFVSHDLKNPLAAIELALRSLRSSPTTKDARSERAMASIERCSKRMGRLIRGVLDTARHEAGRPLQLDPRPTPLGPLLERAQSEARPRGEHVDIRVELEENLPPLEVDPLRVEQAVLNLLENAVQASPEGGEVTIEANRQGDDRVELCVHNEGEALPAAAMDTLFQPFWRAGRSPGDGLGLAIVKSVVEAHRGAVWATNPPAGGVTFHLTLPVAKAATS